MNINKISLKISRLLLCLALAVATACTTADVSNASDFMEQRLSGKIGGKAWTYKYAYVDPTINTPEEDDYVFVFLPYKPKDRCPQDADSSGDSRSILVSAPKVTDKAMPLKRGSSRNLVFHYFDKGNAVAHAALKGRIKLTSIDAQTVKGRLMGTLNGSNAVNGDFVATVCEVGDMNKGSPWED